MPTGEDTRDDQQLIAAINLGDSDAFASLYGRYRDWVYQLAYRFTNHHADAQDVLQETFGYLVRKFPGFELTSSMKTFLYPAVRNYSIAQRRKRQRAVQDEGLLELAVSAADSLSGDLDDLRDVIRSLPMRQQQVLIMRLVDEMTINEIADALEIPTGTVKSRLHHAIRTLRDSPGLRGYFDREDDS